MERITIALSPRKTDLEVTTTDLFEALKIAKDYLGMTDEGLAKLSKEYTELLLWVGGISHSSTIDNIHVELVKVRLINDLPKIKEEI